MRTRRTLALLGAMLALVLVATGCREEEEPTPTTSPAEAAPPPTLKEGVLQVGSCLDYPPFESVEGGNETGFDVDLAEEIAGRIGLEVEWVRADFDTIFTSVAAGQFDMVAAASTITEERDEVVDFSDPYYQARQSLAVNTEETPEIASTDDIGDGHVIGVQKGTTGADWAEENLKPQGAKIKTYQSATDAFRDLEAGGITGVVNDEPSTADVIKDLPALKIVEPIDTDEEYGFAFSPDAPELREAVNGALEEIIADGTYAQIFETYFPGVEPPAEFTTA
jgi:ABC-type amino acid transport substrate-binding protein